jgi:NAD(P)-dependent dehydrogenase (short-subunit alcohol dehydrogenase family)
MDLKLTDKRALITGASLGIGRAVADELAREGCDLALVARDEKRLAHVARDIAAASGRKVSAVAGDIARTDAIPALVDQACAALGGIDILVNNAGSTPEDGIARLDFDEWRHSVELKLFGYARFAQCVLPGMQAQKWGRIVNIIGRSGHQPRPVYLAGGSINAGLLNLTKALAEAGAKDNVLVTGVNPGPIDTPRWDTLRNKSQLPPGEFDARAIAGVPLGRLGRAD